MGVPPSSLISHSMVTEVLVEETIAGVARENESDPYRKGSVPLSRFRPHLVLNIDIRAQPYVR